MRAAFFHGLESPAVSEKNTILEKHFSEVYAPPMNYRDPALFARVLQDIQENRPDFLIGSSMGGWFAFCLSTVTGIPTLLFNPALVGRSFDPAVETGGETPRQTVVLGKDDEVVNGRDSMSWLVDNYDGGMLFTHEKMAHRIPAEIFEKWVSKIS